MRKSGKGATTRAPVGANNRLKKPFCLKPILSDNKLFTLPVLVRYLLCQLFAM